GRHSRNVPHLPLVPSAPPADAGRHHRPPRQPPSGHRLCRCGALAGRPAPGGRRAAAQLGARRAPVPRHL
ncbi:MAG: hypothetical protein AVDCRST_MAG65-235, partial [uncultured Solirubrobacteraceae bacterium]